MVDVVRRSPIEAAREAFTRHAWREAYERFDEADHLEPLGASDLESFADAAWWSGQPDIVFTLRERAYAGYQESEPRKAAQMALRLFQDNAMKGSATVASAWLGRAQRLLEHDQDTPEYGYLRLLRGLEAGNSGDPDTALSEARAALEFGTRFGNKDLQALSLNLQGQALITKGQVREGMALVDEATIAAVTGELTLFTTGVIYCSMIGACRDLGDYRRAGEWTEAAMRWCERQSVNGFPGICRVHRAELLALRGALAKAEQEARLARDEIVRWDIRWILGESFYEIGSIRLRMGDLPAAEESFRRAHEVGRIPEPGMSLIRLAEGKAAAANAALQRTLAEERSQPARARMLPAQVQIALAAGDLETARAAADDLDRIAATFDTVALKGSAHDARGAVLLAEGDAERAGHELQEALALWQQLDAPYEGAVTRTLIATCLEASGDKDAALFELRTAKATFERIGAMRDARLVADRLGDLSDLPRGVPGDTVTRTFLFTDIVSSTNLIGVIGDEAWQDLIRWHDDALRAVIAEHSGQEIRHQGDGLVVSFETAVRAIECAIAIQRRLADHRRAHGFAPAVRIGVHQATVTQRGLDYAGVGVHEAARVGSIAGGGEILVTRATLDAAGRPFSTGEARTVELKGIAQPVEVLSVAWR